MNLFDIFAILNRQDKKALVILSISSILISVIEAAGIYIIVLFVTIASDFNTVHDKKIINYLYNISKIQTERNFVVLFGAIAILFYLLRGFVVYIYSKSLSRYTHSKAISIADELFAKYLMLPYEVFKNKNTSTLKKTIVHEASHLISIVSSLMIMVSEALIILIMAALIVVADHKIAIILFVFLAGIIYPVARIINKKIKIAGLQRERLLVEFYEQINRSFNCFKLLKLAPDTYSAQYAFKKKSAEYCSANVTNASLSQVPRLFLETTSFVALTLLILGVLLNTTDNISTSLGLITMYVLAFYRMMPSISRVISASNQITYYSKSIEIIKTDLGLDSENLKYNKILFDRDIKLDNVCFNYQNHKEILSNISLTIRKGERIGITGDTGSGKSTLVDIICGLHKPTKGKLYCSGVVINEQNLGEWRKKIAYIPQHIYLFDGTVAENILFGQKRDDGRLCDVLARVGLLDYFNQRSGLNTEVGEGGRKLSGGQIQRVALARALYRHAEIIVLDEGTSGLDFETECDIMNEVYSIDKNTTIFIVAHRISTLSRCDRRIHLKSNGCYDVQK